ncbi:unnamed protein product [Mytilus edulis]|uniref:Uncharacterized protein n=1 Tax=Mytilus edulis TaxID=6550 RepID=A0A8S3T7Y6_MYTED|nr:unnamed protein product [Mytilus edulis]
MFSNVSSPCANHRKRPNPGNVQSICCVAAAPGIASINLDPSLGINFFKHPDQSLIDEINSLRDCTDINLEMNISYALLVYTLLNTSSFDVNRIDISKLETIIESFCNSQRRRLFDSKVKKIAEQIDGRFLKQDTQTMVYHFKHPMINEAIAISYFEVNPSAVISVLNFDFIIDLIRLELR